MATNAPGDGAVPGVYHRAGAASAAVVLRWDPARGALVLEGAGVQTAVPAARLTLAPGGWRGGAVHFVWREDGGEASVTVEDARALSVLERSLPAALAEALGSHRAESRRRARRNRVLLTLLALVLATPVALIGALLLHPDPFLDRIVARLPTAVDEALGEQLESELAAGGRTVAGLPLEAVETLGARLLAEAPEAPFAFRFHVLEDPEVNAFAAPGGVVAVHTGLLLAAESPEELAGVLAHEIAHVLERHSLR